MSPEALIDLIFTATVTGILGALLWTRLNRLEGRVDSGLDEVKRDLADVRERMATRSDLDKLSGEMAVMRSDLTHVALAVGANRPKPVEG